MTVRCKDNEGKRKAKKKEDIPPKRMQFEWLTSPSIISLHSFYLQVVVFGPKETYPGSHYSIGSRLLPLRFSKQLTHRFWSLAFSPIFVWAVPNIYPGFF
jgi:hypothetical protein